MPCWPCSPIAATAIFLASCSLLCCPDMPSSPILLWQQYVFLLWVSFYFYLSLRIIVPFALPPSAKYPTWPKILSNHSSITRFFNYFLFLDNLTPSFTLFTRILQHTIILQFISFHLHMDSFPSPFYFATNTKLKSTSHIIYLLVLSI